MMTSRDGSLDAMTSMLERLPFRPLAGLILVLATLLRLSAATDEFWLDEVWSLYMVKEMASVADIFTRAAIDNNHFLNTSLLYLLGTDRAWILYRLPAVLAGVGTVVMAGVIGAHRSRNAALVALFVLAFSYPMIHYASEARGYAYLSFFCLVAYDALLRLRERPTWAAASVYVLACLLGMLAHLSFLFAYFSFVAWSAWFEGRRRGGLRWLAYQAPPAAFLSLLYVVTLQRAVIGGGDPYHLPTVILQALALALSGLHESGPREWLAAAVTVGVVGTRAVVCLRQRDDRGIVLIGVYLLPALVLAFSSPEVLYPRYFLVAITFALLAFADLATDLLEMGPKGRALGTIALLVFLAINSLATQRLLTLGRGHYREVIDHMLVQSRERPIAVGGDSDFRHALLLDYYWPRDAVPIRYLRRGEWPREGPEWVLVHYLSGAAAPQPVQTDELGRAFRLTEVFPAAGLSGWGLALYRR